MSPSAGRKTEKARINAQRPAAASVKNSPSGLSASER